MISRSVIAASLLLSIARAVPPAIDGDFRDWDHLPGGDVRLITCAERLYVYLRLSGVKVLQSMSGVSFYLDTDGDAATGFAIGSIGAEYRWDAGLRTGVSFGADGIETGVVKHTDLRWISAPVVDSTEFEISLQRQNLVASNCAVLVVADGAIVGSASGPYESRRFARNATPARSPHSDVRFMTYNVLRDGLFSSAQFLDELSQLQPDVIGFTEIYLNSAEITRQRVAQVLPYMLHAGGSADCRLVSRYPVTNLSSPARSHCARVRSPDGAIDFVVITAHLSCCNYSTSRATELASISTFVSNLRAGLVAGAPADLPVVFAGDLNLVRDDSAAFAGFQASTGLTPLDALHLDSANAYTWFSDVEGFSPGRLDYILTGSGLATLRAFVYKSALPPSDHLPVIADLALDNDGNGLGDSWERNFFGATGQNPATDADGDGWNNGMEFRLGTDPVSANARTFLRSDISNGGALSMEGHGNGAAGFRLMRSENLRDWTVVGRWFPDGGVLPVKMGSRSFFRAVFDD